MSVLYIILLVVAGIFIGVVGTMTFCYWFIKRAERKLYKAQIKDGKARLATSTEWLMVGPNKEGLLYDNPAKMATITGMYNSENLHNINEPDQTLNNIFYSYKNLRKKDRG